MNDNDLSALTISRAHENVRAGGKPLPTQRIAVDDAAAPFREWTAEHAD
jgi:hypothetical protein